MHALWLHGEQRTSVAGAVETPPEVTLDEAGEELDDQVIFATPRRPERPAGGGRCEVTPPGKLKRMSPASEASTCAPPSLAQSGSGSLLVSSAASSARMALALHGIGLRRLLWAVSRLGAHADDRRSKAATLAREARLRSALVGEEASVASERKACSELQAEILLLQEGHLGAEQEASLCRDHCVGVQRQLRASEENCATLEARLARKARWRSEAERKIREMVQRGQALEQERVHARQQIQHSTQLLHSRGAQVDALRSSLEQEEQLGEILQARICALEQDNTQLKCLEQQERRCRHEEAAAQDAREADLTRAAEEARRELLAAWDSDRAEWRRKAETLHLRSAEAAEELAEARRAEAQARKLAEARRRESASREDPVSSGVRQLSCHLAQAEALEENLRRLLEEGSAARVPGSGPGPGRGAAAAPGTGTPPAEGFLRGSEGPTPPTTPQLRELDAYAELVERLRGEVGRERAEREATAHSLAALRGSYRLLLQRASSCGTRRSASEGNLRAPRPVH